jgi:ABC-type lipoprotein export system ATPase subunit
VTGLPVLVRGLRQVYTVEGEQVVALDNADLTVESGQSLAVLGPSGSGKSSLLTLIAGLHRPTAGTITVGDQEITALGEGGLLRVRGRDLAMVAQGPARNLLLWATVADNVAFAQQGVARRRRAGLPGPAELLASLAMGELIGRRVDQLSGGEKQRLAVVLGVATEPGLLLLDEPTSQLDHVNRDLVIDLIRRIVDEFGTTVIVVTHDEEMATALHRVVAVKAGQLTETTGRPGGQR